MMEQTDQPLVTEQLGIVRGEVQQLNAAGLAAEWVTQQALASGEEVQQQVWGDVVAQHEDGEPEPSITEPAVAAEESPESEPAADAGTPPTIKPPGDGGTAAGEFPEDSNDDQSGAGTDVSAVAIAEGATRTSLEGQSISDPELSRLLAQGAEAIGDDALDRILRAAESFNQPVTILEEDSTQTYDAYFSYKRLLSELPRYAQAASDAGVLEAEAGELLSHALGVVRYPDIQHADLIAANLSHALEAMGQADEATTTQRIAEIKDLITKAGEDDVIEMSLSAYESGCKAGLSPEDSLRVVDGHLSTANYRQLGYTMYQFRDALRSLDAAGVDPAVTKEVFGLLEGMHPEYRGEVYEEVKAVVTFGVPASGKTAAEMMQDIAARLRSGTDTASELPGEQFQHDGVTIFAPREQRERYFRAVHGTLENRAVPYRTERSWSDGIADITGLTDARNAKGELVSEGNWVYDPGTSTWYSLGGETRYVGPGRIRHTAAQYDISELSETPVSLHIHPAEYARMSDKYGFVFPTNADYRAAAFMMENAHSSAYLRSFISHPLGMTEFAYPQDPQTIRQVAETFEAVRDSFFHGRFDDEEHILAWARYMGSGNFARASVQEINQMLPAGFSITFYPRGTNPEDMRQ